MNVNHLMDSFYENSSKINYRIRIRNKLNCTCNRNPYNENDTQIFAYNNNNQTSVDTVSFIQFIKYMFFFLNFELTLKI